MDVNGYPSRGSLHSMVVHAVVQLHAVDIVWQMAPAAWMLYSLICFTEQVVCLPIMNPVSCTINKHTGKYC